MRRIHTTRQAEKFGIGPLLLEAILLNQQLAALDQSFTAFASAQDEAGVADDALMNRVRSALDQARAAMHEMLDHELIPRPDGDDEAFGEVAHAVA